MNVEPWEQRVAKFHESLWVEELRIELEMVPSAPLPPQVNHHPNATSISYEKVNNTDSANRLRNKINAAAIANENNQQIAHQYAKVNGGETAKI